MYRQPKSFPIWLVAIAAAMLIFGGYYLWNGMIGFLGNAGKVAATDAANPDSNPQPTATAGLDLTESAFSYSFAATAVPRQCVDFYVTVGRARVAECPRDNCKGIIWPGQNALVCVFGPAQNAPDWYEVNLSPTDPLPKIGYIRGSVVRALHPTPRPSRTPIPPPTTSPLPPTPTPLPLATVTDNPVETPTITPTTTPLPNIRQA